MVLYLQDKCNYYPAIYLHIDTQIRDWILEETDKWLTQNLKYPANIDKCDVCS